ncbi:MAG: hypothetical protein EOP62_09485 [Sphingomonadales bacterium]|nr:MAG: hypothetical protein EOP62_09485 [Sphingomonadales bacterium]
MLRAILLAATTGAVVNADSPELRFIGCPVYRDTDAGRKSGCWLVTDPATGIRYDVTSSPTKPDWNHAVLVEGRADAKAGDTCGGMVIDPARVSVLEAPCPRFALRGEGFTGRKFALPARNVRPLYDVRKKQNPPFQEGRFTIPFDFGGSFVVYQLSDYYMDAMINYALDVQPARIEIAASADTRPTVVSGTTLSEPRALATQRAQVIRQSLILRGISPDTIKIVSATRAPYVAAAFDGLDAPAARRVDVRIIPGPSR